MNTPSSSAGRMALTMNAWHVVRPGPIEAAIRRVGVPGPGPSAGEVLVKGDACGVCRTGLHIAMGALPAPRSPVVPGHEIVGRGVARGTGASRFEIGDRVGVAWLRHTC